MSKTLAEMTAEIREINVEKGWRPADGGPGTNTFGDYLALLHSEVSEVLEAYRDHRLDDATIPHCAEEGCPRAGRIVSAETCSLAEGRDAHCTVPGKPEGVGSELADVLIRLLDMSDVLGIKPFDMDMELGDVAPLDDAQGMKSFGDHLAWLHYLIGGLTTIGYGRGWSEFLRAVVTVADQYQVNLTAEYERKVAFNRTRSFRHGGRAL